MVARALGQGLVDGPPLLRESLRGASCGLAPGPIGAQSVKCPTALLLLLLPFLLLLFLLVRLLLPLRCWNDGQRR